MLIDRILIVDLENHEMSEDKKNKIILNIDDLKLDSNTLNSKCEDDNFFDSILISHDSASPQKEENSLEGADLFADLTEGTDAPPSTFNFGAIDTSSTDKRKYVRVDLKSRVLVKDEQQNIIGKALGINISEKGLGLFIDMGTVHKGMKVHIEFVGDENIPAISLSGTIARAEGKATKDTIGITLDKPSALAQRKINEYIGSMINND